MKPYYLDLQKNTADKLQKYDNSFSFAVVADSHLDNSVPDTCDNIKSVSSKSNLSCVLHMGDIMCGGFPRAVANEIMRDEIKTFVDASPNGEFFVTRGNHDGFGDPVKSRADVLVDGDWNKAIEYVDSFSNVSRDADASYYYVDYADYKTRLICLNSYSVRRDPDDEDRGNIAGYNGKQLEWFATCALDVPKDFTVLVFSHDLPFKNFPDAISENSIVGGNAMIEALLDAKAKNGFDFAGWLVGHFHGDFEHYLDSIPFVCFVSQTAYVPTLFEKTKAVYPARHLGTLTEDAWDAVVVDKEDRKLRLFRFGAGKDREVSY